MTWVVAREDDYGAELYWTGETSDYGFPLKTRDETLARSFKNARAAYEAAGNVPKLESWRVRAV